MGVDLREIFKNKNFAIVTAWQSYDAPLAILELGLEIDVILSFLSDVLMYWRLLRHLR